MPGAKFEDAENYEEKAEDESGDNEGRAAGETFRHYGSAQRLCVLPQRR